VKKRGLYSRIKLPESLKKVLEGQDFVISEEEKGSEELKFHLGSNKTDNIFLKEIDWLKVKTSPCAFINEEVLEWDIPALIAKRFFQGESAVNPESGFNGVLQKNSSLKITREFSGGLITDEVAKFASDNKVSPVQVRSYLNSILSFLEYLRISDHAGFPVDLDFGVSKDSFYIQANCPVEEIYIENFLESTKEASLKNPFVSLLEDSVKKTDLLEIYTLSSSRKLVLTACWVKNPNYIRKNNSPSLLIHQVSSFKSSSIAESSKHIETIVHEVIDEEPLLKTITGEVLPSHFIEKETKPRKKNPILIKRLVNHIFSTHSNTFEYESYDKDNLALDLEQFHDQDAITSIMEEEKEEVIRLVVSGDGYSDLVEETKRIKRSIDQEEYLESLLNSIEDLELKRVVGGAEISEDDDLQKVSGLDQSDDSSQRIIGNKEEPEFTQVVKGVGEEEADDSILIAGSAEDLDEGTWKVKRSETIEKVRGRFNDLRNQGASNQDIDKEVKAIFIKELNLDEDSVANLVEEIGDDIADDFLRNKMRDSGDSVRQEVLIHKLEKKLDMRAQQVEKMKSLISSLSSELKTAKERNSSSEGFHILNKDFEGVDEAEEKTTYEKAKSIEHEREVEKLAKENEKLGRENEILLRKFKENLSEPSTEESSVQEVEAENDNLKVQVESLKKKISFMYENSKASKDVVVSASEVQKIIEDKERYFSEKMKLKKDLEDQKMEVRGLENKIKTLEVKANSSKANSSHVNGGDKTELIAKEKELENIRVRMNKLQADSKAHELKAKSFEQKVKFLNAQLEKYQKEEGRQKMKRGGPSAIETKMSGRMKQMEAAGRKLKLANEKLSKELAEKKTEAHKATLESKTMNLKLKDLERKMVALTKKKAA
jgi:hypothetical protein